MTIFTMLSDYLHPKQLFLPICAAITLAPMAGLAQAPQVANSEPQPSNHVRSRITVYDLRDKSLHVVYTADRLIQSPNWSKDGTYLLANSEGKLYRFNLSESPISSKPLSLDSIYACNNDHGFSPDMKTLAFSATAKGATGSQVYLANIDGSEPHLIVPEIPSYYHGWSPDGHWLALVSEREGSYNIFRISAQGGPQQRLTSHPGHDDGPDYSPDGKWIFINSERTGTEQIWRFPADGAGDGDSKAERLTDDDTEDWFPHPSPDSKWLVYLSFPKGTSGHNVRTNIELRILPIKNNAVSKTKPQVLARIFGGQGTINVNSWSPDSTRLAFVSYEILP